MRLLAAVLFAFVAARSQGPPVPAGLVIVDDGKAVLAMQGPGLRAGTSITLVGIDSRQRVWRARVVRSVEASPAMTRHETSGPYYEIAADPGQAPLPALAVAVTGRPQARRTGAFVILRLVEPPVSVRVRSCASSEGLHLTMWAGEPLKSRRLWHAYYYLGYDVEPNCQPADVRPGG
jgi:hypothetical protein